MCLKNRYNAQNKVSKAAWYTTWSPPVNYLRAEARSDDAEIQIELFCARNTCSIALQFKEGLNQKNYQNVTLPISNLVLPMDITCQLWSNHFQSPNCCPIVYHFPGASFCQVKMRTAMKKVEYGAGTYHTRMQERRHRGELLRKNPGPKLAVIPLPVPQFPDLPSDV